MLITPENRSSSSLPERLLPAGGRRQEMETNRANASHILQRSRLRKCLWKYFWALSSYLFALHEGYASVGETTCFVAGKNIDSSGRVLSELFYLNLKSWISDSDHCHCFSSATEGWSSVAKYPMKINAPACTRIGEQVCEHSAEALISNTYGLN